MKNAKYTMGVVSGVFGTLLAIVAVCALIVMFNIGGLGDVVRTVTLLENRSLNELSLSEKSEGMISGMLTELEDPYSYYLNADDYSDLMEEVSGSYEGLGIYLTTFPDAQYTTIMAPIKGTPAFDAGLLAGDEILSINGESMAGATADEISNLVKNGEESHFVMEILRDGEILTFEMDRTHIDIPTVEAQFLSEEEGIAYVNISNFAETTPTEVYEGISALEKERPVNGIILDLRNNPGGSLTAVISVADLFLSQGQHIIWVEEKSNEECIDAVNTNPYAYPLVVLVNENSASASEILAGALKDNDRAEIVGMTTFGKGIIQSIYGLRGGGAVKVTTAEYLSPDKNKIHEVG
ncbi:MAG: PDZ domain-containing protein, partial [Firmicutes bacterium]|nr:PDZ domain-containing protein [Bacillota bacterium]